MRRSPTLPRRRHKPGPESGPPTDRRRAFRGDHKGGVVWGTMGDDVLVGGNQRQIIMGLGGDDELRGGNSGDCLVGGPGTTA